TYDALYSLDEDFRKLFPLRAEFNSIVEVNKNVSSYINKTILNKIKENNLMPIAEDGINEVIRFLSRAASNKTKVNIDITEIERLIILANDNAKKRKASMIDSKDIIDIAYVTERIEDDYDKLYK
ncbi:AAA family ATPase, partial [Clostridium perfringens]|uniref:Lon-insertion domain-containing protein n=1 Tax=Clostridium perfringens TaxID=1502 RepID=UPI002AC6C031|nr:AAA family ATPase [Clostridium perfringens]